MNLHKMKSNDIYANLITEIKCQISFKLQPQDGNLLSLAAEAYCFKY